MAASRLREFRVEEDGTHVATFVDGTVISSANGVEWRVGGGVPATDEQEEAESSCRQAIIRELFGKLFPRPFMAGDIVMAPPLEEGALLVHRVVETRYNYAGMITCAGAPEAPVPGTPEELSLLPMYGEFDLRLFYDEA